MNDPASPHAEFQRGCQLYELRRFDDAAAAFRRVLAQDPQHAWALHQLARVLWRQDREAEALPLVRQAIGLEPDEAEHQILHAHVLVAQEKHDDALRAADEAVRLDPAHPGGFAARATVHNARARWREAEEAARQALALDPEFDLAHHHLAHALRQQGRGAEQAEAVQHQLRRNPDDPLAHANAGWAALERGEVRRAQEHFAAALRLSPEFEWAREGLVQSFRARSPLYRAYLAYSFWMSKRRAGQQWAIVLGLYLGARFARAIFTGEWRWLGLVVGIGYFVFAFWIWVARGIGNLLLLTDRFGRLVLRPHEKLEALAIGGGAFGGIALAAAGLALHRGEALIAGLLLVFSCIPLACTFDNTRVLGRWLFGGIAAFAWAVALASVALGAAAVADTAPLARAVDALVTPALLGCALTSWIGNIGALRQSR